MPITKATASSIAPAAKGDLVVGSATNDASVLAVGSANQVLTVDSSTTTGLKWATPTGGGKVLQVVHGSTTTQVTVSSPTFTDTTLTATITPSSTSSKVLVLVSHNGNWRSGGNQNNSLTIKLLRGSTEIGRTGGINWIWPGATPVIESITGSVSLNVLDSPSSTSALTYKTQFANINNSAAAGVQYTFGSLWDTTSYITLLEIGA